MDSVKKNNNKVKLKMSQLIQHLQKAKVYQMLTLSLSQRWKDVEQVVAFVRKMKLESVLHV